MIGRLDALRGEYSTKLLLGQAKLYQDNGHAEGVSEIAGRVRARLFDLSAFMKELKQKLIVLLVRSIVKQEIIKENPKELKRRMKPFDLQISRDTL